MVNQRFIMTAKLGFSFFSIITLEKGTCACSLLCLFCLSVYKLVRSMVHFDWAKMSCNIVIGLTDIGLIAN